MCHLTCKPKPKPYASVSQPARHNPQSAVIFFRCATKYYNIITWNEVCRNSTFFTILVFLRLGEMPNSFYQIILPRAQKRKRLRTTALGDTISKFETKIKRLILVFSI